MSSLNINNKKRDEELSTISGVQFGVLSPEEIVRRSVVNITETTLYDSSGEPKFGGLFDPRMGVIERKKRCKTCEQTYVLCPGHFGHIELAKPVFNLQFKDYIRKILQCVCIRCSKLLVDKNDPAIKSIVNNKKPIERLDAIKNKVKTKVCGVLSTNKTDENTHGCGAVQPKYPQEEIEYIFAEWSHETNENGTVKKEQQKLTAEIVLHILKRISKEDAYVLGFSEDWCLPHWLICTVLPVVPPSVRPSVKMYNNQRSEDDITHKYNDILKHNNSLKEKLKNTDTPEDQIISWTNLIQYDVGTLMDNEQKGLPICTSRGGRSLKGFKQRLHGKEGRIRSNLMGKRVDFSARSVISPDANLNIEELGVPIKIAMNLTYPEIVNKYNIDKMYKLIRNGPKIYPGAKTWVKKNPENGDGRTRSLEYIQDVSSIVLNYGDVVNRHLLDGDVVLFNRQPSLHKMSMMAHKIRVMEGKTFRLNVDVCKPYNADFDGDEMNMHVPQSIQTAIELKYLAAVPKQIISPSSNSPIIVPSQDNLLGLYKITNDNVYFTQKEFMNLFVGVDDFDGTIPTPEINTESMVRWTGKQAVSVILPPINIINSKITIEKGILKKGSIEKKMSSLIVHIIFKDFGYKVAQRYLNNLQKIITRYMVRSGFSVGISDLIVPNDMRDRNEDIIINCKKEVVDIARQIHLNIFENVSKGVSELYEAKIQSLLGKTTKKIESETEKVLTKDNRVNFMVKSGSKGKATNICQMSCLLGQQMVDGKRIALGFANRSLPHYQKYDNGIESKGYVVNNFKDGLTPQEFFFHAMAGREGLIDTAVKTAKSGYIQRKLIKTTEDLKANHDYTVRNSNESIVQFIYGDDGFNSIYLEKQNFNHLILVKQEFLDNNIYLSNDIKWDSFMTKKAVDKMKSIKKNEEMFTEYNDYVLLMIKNLHDKIKSYVMKNNKPIDDISSDYTIFFPINFGRILQQLKITYKLNQKNKSDIDPIYIINMYKKLVDDCKINGNTNTLLQLLLIDKISPLYLLRDLRITRVAFDYLINMIYIKFHKSLVQGGEMVGPIAAQSIGEISTQLTLNTFHYAGVGEASNVNQGVPRLEELLNVGSKIKQPQLIIYLNEEYRKELATAEQVKYNLELVKIGDLIKSDAIYLEPSNNIDDVLQEDKDIMKIYSIFSELDNQYQSIPNNPWIIRLEFNHREMVEKNITMDEIYTVLNQQLNNSSIMFSDDNSGKLIFRMRLEFDSNKQNVDDDIQLLTKKIEEIKEIPIKGLEGIEKIYRPKENHTLIVPDGDLFKMDKEYYLETSGGDLFDVLIKDYVDSNRTTSINIVEIYQVFGIEAARWALEYQLNDVMTKSDSFTSPRNIGLLSDAMTYRGKIMAANRNGINQSDNDIGPLAKSSFEETTEQLKIASIFGSYDNINGVSSNIMVGQIPKCGTGDTKIILDEDKLIQTETPTTSKETFNIEEILQTNDYCDDNVDIAFDINNIDSDNVNLMSLNI